MKYGSKREPGPAWHYISNLNTFSFRYEHSYTRKQNASNNATYTHGQKFSDFCFCTCQIFKLIFWDCYKMAFCNMNCTKQFITFLILGVNPLRFIQLALRTSLNTKMWCSLSQLIRHQAFKNKWTVKRMNQCVLLMWRIRKIARSDRQTRHAV